MHVETFEVTEVNEAGVTCDADSIALINSLGLEGQQKLIKKDIDGKINLIPYRKMTRAEKQVYKILLPEHCDPKSYSDGPIPLRVLQLIAHGREMFTSLEVWYPSNADVKDPLLIGVNKVNYDYEYFIMARWGEVLESFEVLTGMAQKMHMDAIRNELVKCYQSAKLELDSLNMDGILSMKIPEFRSMHRQY